MMFVGMDNAEAGSEGDASFTDGVESDTDIDLDGDGEIDTDIDTPSEISDMGNLKIFTVRGLIAFFVVFGWMGIVLLGAGVHLAITIPVSVLCGAAMMLLLAILFKAVLKLRSDGNLDNKNALGTAGKVHLTIPPSRQGEGKVHLMLQGSYVERNAVTDSNEPIPTGSEVIVIGISGQTDLVVRKK